MNTLKREYEKIRPEFGATGFNERVFKRICTNYDSSPEGFLTSNDKIKTDQLNEIVLEIETTEAPFDLLIIYASCAYGVACQRIALTGDSDRAWNLMADATLHLGWAFAVGLGEKIYTDEILKHLNSLRAQKGAEGRHKLHREMKELAYTYVRNNPGLRNQTQAVNLIEVMLREKYPDNRLQDPHNTITNWLRQMPDKEKYFKVKK